MNFLMMTKNNLNVIRIQQEEYDEIPKSGLYAHFNLGVANHVPGETYFLARILKHGHDDVEPVLSFENILTGKCVSVKLGVPIDSLSEADFEFSMSGIKDTASLKEIILSRYTKSRPHLSKEEILNMGVTITLLEIKNQ